MVITLGADPEVFFSNGEREISAIGKIGGTKAEPKQVGFGYALQEDNVAGEFNIPPASNIDQWDIHVKTGLGIIESYAKKNNCVLSVSSCAKFNETELEHPQAKEFGCEPDYNAWTLEVNESPSGFDPALRSAGGHVHVGGIDEVDSVMVIRALDLFLGVPSVFLDSNDARRKLYGKAGAFRPKEYGVEYRVLSNFWIFSTEFRRWVWRATNKAISFAREYKLEADSETGKLIIATINNSDFDGYKALTKTYPAIIPEL